MKALTLQGDAIGTVCAVFKLTTVLNPEKLVHTSCISLSAHLFFLLIFYHMYLELIIDVLEKWIVFVTFSTSPKYIFYNMFLDIGCLTVFLSDVNLCSFH
jgi:hypothetical protein